MIMSTNHTPNYQLSQWEPDDQFLRADFNEDNAKIDAALKAKADASALAAVASTIPKIAAGKYVGDGAESREIVVGFRPKFVLVVGQMGRLTEFVAGHTDGYGGAAVDGSPSIAYYSYPQNILEITQNGFLVFSKENRGSFAYTNSNNSIMHYLAVG